MSYGLIALDIDGTIRSDEHPLSERTRLAVARVMDAGAAVTVATGRVFRSALPAVTELGLRWPVVSFQGAHIADPSTGEVLWHRPLTPAMARTALDALANWSVEIVAYHEDRVYAAEITPWARRYEERTGAHVTVVDDLSQIADMAPTRLLAVGTDDEVELLEAHLKARFDSDLYVTRSLPHFCEVLHPEGGKDKGLAWLCDRLGVSPNETVAFGNGYNDVPMLEWAGLGVAVAGAVPEALRAADMMAPPLEEDGAAHVLEDLLQRGLIGRHSRSE